MPKAKEKSNNMKLAGLFVLLVFGLIFLSVVFKIIFLIKDSQFNSNNKFNVAFVGKETTQVVSFSPNNKSISILELETKIESKELSKFLQVPIDGIIYNNAKSINKKNLSSSLFKSFIPFGEKEEKMTSIDSFRLFIFSRGVSSNSIYTRKLAKELNENQKATIISLTFTDPKIYEESLSIEVVNATGIFGLGARLAAFVSNIGGNVVLITSDDKLDNKSKIVYSGEETYTVKKLSSVLGFPLEKAGKRGIADVIIIVGKQKDNNYNF